MSSWHAWIEKGSHAYVGGNPIALRDALGIWSIGEPQPGHRFDFSVGVGDGLSFGIGRLVRSFTQYADDVSTCSTADKSGVQSGAVA